MAAGLKRLSIIAVPYALCGMMDSMCENKQKDRIERWLPASRDLMLVVRLATSGVVARAGLTIDVLDDVKMAVEEACMYMMTQVPGTARLKLQFGLGEQAIEVGIGCEAEDADMKPCVGTEETAELEVVRCILESLVDEVEICQCGDRIEEICLKAGLRR